MRYLFVVRDDEDAVGRLPRDRIEEFVAQHVAFVAMLRERGVLVFNGALAGGAQDATVVRPDTGLITDGPFTESTEQVGAVYVVDCAHLDAALELARKVPVSPGISVEIRRLADA